MSENKRVKTNEEATRPIPPSIHFDVAELTENPTDRCSVELLESTMHWVATSHIVGPGDTLKITTRESDWKDHVGWINRELNNGMYEILVRPEPEQIFRERLCRGGFECTGQRRVYYGRNF